MREVEIAEPRLALAAVARDARPIVDQRQPPADQPVEQRRLADIRPADDGDGEAHARDPVVSHRRSGNGPSCALPTIATDCGPSSPTAAAARPRLPAAPTIGRRPRCAPASGRAGLGGRRSWRLATWFVLRLAAGCGCRLRPAASLDRLMAAHQLGAGRPAARRARLPGTPARRSPGSGFLAGPERVEVVRARPENLSVYAVGAVPDRGGPAAGERQRRAAARRAIRVTRSTRGISKTSSGSALAVGIGERHQHLDAASVCPTGVSASVMIMSNQRRAVATSPARQAESASISRAEWRKARSGAGQTARAASACRSPGRGVDQQQPGAHGGEILQRPPDAAVARRAHRRPSRRPPDRAPPARRPRESAPERDSRLGESAAILANAASASSCLPA